jgi:ATP/maltotriose-dependent transcriptional regulator MalT
LSRALAWEAAHLSNLGGRTWRRAQRLLGKARRLADQVADPYARGWTALCDGIVNFTNGRWPAARSQLEQAERTLRGECTGVAWEVNTAQAFLLWNLFYYGDLPEMRRRVASLVPEALERGDQYAAATHSTFCLPIIQLVDGDPQAARVTVAKALSQWTYAGFHVQHFIALMSQTYIDLYCGRGEAAWQRMQEQWPLARRSQLLRVQVLRTLLTHLRGRAALAYARESPTPGPLLRAAQRDARQLLRENMPYCTPHGRHLLAGVAALQGDRAAALRMLEDAVRGYESCHMSLLAAATRCRWGELRGDDEGLRMADEARTFFQDQAVDDIDRFLHALTAIPAPDALNVRNEGKAKFALSR